MTSTQHTAGQWRADIRNMFSLTSTGRNGKRKPHAVLIDPQGRIAWISDARTLELGLVDVGRKAAIRNGAR